MILLLFLLSTVNATFQISAKYKNNEQESEILEVFLPKSHQRTKLYLFPVDDCERKRNNINEELLSPNAFHSMRTMLPKDFEFFITLTPPKDVRILYPHVAQFSGYFVRKRTTGSDIIPGFEKNQISMISGIWQFVPDKCFILLFSKKLDNFPIFLIYEKNFFFISYVADLDCVIYANASSKNYLILSQSNRVSICGIEDLIAAVDSNETPQGVDLDVRRVKLGMSYKTYRYRTNALLLKHSLKTTTFFRDEKLQI